MPALTPADVIIDPSGTKIASGSTWTAGKREAS